MPQDQLQLLVDFSRSVALRASSRATYSSQVTQYRHLCQLLGLDPDLPITEEFHLECLSWLFCYNHSVHSLPSFFSAIEQHYRANSWDKLPRGQQFRQTARGLKNIFGLADVVSPAPALDLDDLRRLRASLDMANLRDLQFWCALSFGFFGLLRAGEFTGNSLCWKDLSFHPDGIYVTVPFSKTSLTPTPIFVARRFDDLCPVHAAGALSAYATPSSRFQPLYPYSYNAFNSEFKRRATAAGITKAVTSHSIRRGGATELFLAGVPEHLIMAHGRWVSMTWRQYIEFGASQQRIPTMMLRDAHAAR